MEFLDAPVGDQVGQPALGPRFPRTMIAENAHDLRSDLGRFVRLGEPATDVRLISLGLIVVGVVGLNLSGGGHG